MLAAIGQGVSVALVVYGGLLSLAHRDVLEEPPGETRTNERARRIARSFVTPASYRVQERAATAALVIAIAVVAVVY